MRRKGKKMMSEYNGEEEKTDNAGPALLPIFNSYFIDWTSRCLVVSAVAPAAASDSPLCLSCPSYAVPHSVRLSLLQQQQKKKRRTASKEENGKNHHYHPMILYHLSRFQERRERERERERSKIIL